MKKLVLICSLLCATLMFSQEYGIIKGQITDQELNDEPLLYADITIKGTKTTVQTNLHGNFFITDVAPGNYTLAISYPGYGTADVPIEVKVNEATIVQTSLAAKTMSLEELTLVSEKSGFSSGGSLLAKEEKD